MTIAEIVRRGKGRAHAWRVEQHRNGRTQATLYHYSTAMLVWNVDAPTDPDVLDYGLGWGSASDQGGMNTAFSELGLPLYYSRRGGAEILETTPRNVPDADTHAVKFGTLHPDGSLTNQRAIRQADILACPHVILLPDHYREDGSCRCNDAAEQARLIREAAYSPSDFPTAA